MAGAVVGSAVLIANDRSPPEALTGPVLNPGVPLVPIEVADERKVSVLPQLHEVVPLIARRQGTLTATNCAVGEEVASGTVFAVIDDTPVVALATAVPLWRNLGPGDTGDDVRALQETLNELGHAVAISGTFDDATAGALSQVYASTAPTDGTNAGLRVADVLWLDDSSLRADWCLAIGSTVEPGVELARAAPRLTGFTLTSVPPDLLKGEREVIIDGVALHVDDTGHVHASHDELDTLSAAPFVATRLRTDLPGGWEVPLRLSTPISAYSLPPSAIVYDSGATCILTTDGDLIDVETLGSFAGKTVVTLRDDVADGSLIQSAPEATQCSSG